MSEDVLRFPPEGRGEATGALFGPAFQYLRADRVNPATSYSKSYHAVSSRRFMGARGEYAAHFLSQFQNQPVSEPLRRRMSEGFTTGLLSQVNAWMQEFSPGVHVDVHDVENTDFVRLSYRFGLSAGLGGSNSYRPTNVGFGLTYSLPIVVACLATPPGGLVLFENPEAHLHPQGQAAMGRLMAITASTGVQVIVETHSDHVLNGIRLAIKDGALKAEQATPHFFRRHAATGAVEIETPTLTGRGRLSFWPEGFFDQWDKSLDALLD
jgi:predicted ATPase